MNIVTYPDPILTTPTMDIVKVQYSHVELALKMHEKQKELGAVGLAANQVGVSKSIVVIHPHPTSPVLFMINPKILSYAGVLIDSYEGCVSIPGKMFHVKRFPEITVRYTDLAGFRRQETLTGFIALVAQHEIDHLKGITLFDKEKQYDRLNNRDASTTSTAR